MGDVREKYVFKIFDYFVNIVTISFIEIIPEIYPCANTCDLLKRCKSHFMFNPTKVLKKPRFSSASEFLQMKKRLNLFNLLEKKKKKKKKNLFNLLEKKKKKKKKK